MNRNGMDILKRLIAKGVSVPCPESVEIGADIDPERISGEKVTIHSGCRIYGAGTLIMSGTELGYESPVTLHDCQLGRDVRLHGGYFYKACFLDGASMGSGASVRQASLLEEKARGAHTVGLKQTILFPFVTVGSLVNLCDCLMAGGTDERNHSEVGSSYIHFNYTPNRDKATPSLMGDVPGGVMINQPPIFLGGQGGIVGPVRIGYGTVVAAGTIVRKDVLRESTILLGHTSPVRTMPFHQGLYTNIKRIVTLNTIYISSLIVLRRWYLDVRSLFMKGDPMGRALLEGAVEKLNMAIGERIDRLGQVAGRMPESIKIHRKVTSGRASETTVRMKKEFCERWHEIEQAFLGGREQVGNPSHKQAFMDILERAMRTETGYLPVIKGLSRADSRAGTTWLQGMFDEIKSQVRNILPDFKIKV